MVRFISLNGMYLSPLEIAMLLNRINALSSEMFLRRYVIDGTVVLENSIQKIIFQLELFIP